MSGEPKTLTLEEALVLIARDTQYSLVAMPDEDSDEPVALSWVLLGAFDDFGPFTSWVQAAEYAVGVPVVARDEANDNGLRNAVTAFVDKHFHGGSKANRPDYVTMVPTADVYALREALYAARGTTPLQDHKYMADLRAEAAELREGIAAVVKRLEDAGFTTSDNLDALLSIVWDLRRLAGGESEK